MSLVVCVLLVAPFLPEVSNEIVEERSGSNDSPLPDECVFSGIGINIDNWAITPAINLSGITDAFLIFQTKYEIKNNSTDFGHVKISKNSGSSWDILETFQGSQPDWKYIGIDLSSWANNTIMIAFQYTTGSSPFHELHEGWYIDQVIVEKNEIVLYSDYFEKYGVDSNFGDWKIVEKSAPWFDWPMFQYNPQRIGKGQSNGVFIKDDTPYNEYNIGGSIIASPVVSNNGIIYATSTSSSGGGSVYVFDPLDPLGFPLWVWHCETGAEITATPVVSPTGLYIGTEERGGPNIFALDPGTGFKRWELSLGTKIPNDWVERSSLAVVEEDGYSVIYVASGMGYLYRIIDDGTAPGQFDPGANWPKKIASQPILHAPAIGPNGRIYIGVGTPGVLWAIEPDGETWWTYDLPYATYGEQSAVRIIDDVPTIYVGTIGTPSGMHAVEDHGKADPRQKWMYQVSGGVRSSPAVYDLNWDGKEEIIFGSLDTYVYAVTDYGIDIVIPLWKFQTGGPIDSSPVVALATQPTVIVGSTDGKIYSINSGGSEFLDIDSEIHCSPAVAQGKTDLLGASGMVFIGSDDGRFFLLGTPRKTAEPVHNIDTGLNYETIQEAIDAPETSDGHTIIVDPGTYAENIDVYKEVKILPNTLSWFRPGYPCYISWSSWPMFHHNAQNTGCTDVSGPYPLKPLSHWPFDAGNDIIASPVAGEDGTVYITSSSATGGKVYAVDPHGNLKPGFWPFATDAQITSTPAISPKIVNWTPSTRLYVATHESSGPNVFALNPSTGTVIWSLQVQGAVMAGSSLTVAMDPALGKPVIYFGTTSGYFYKIIDNGNLPSIKWQKFLSVPNTIIGFPSSAALNHDNTKVYVGILKDPRANISPCYDFWGNSTECDNYWGYLVALNASDGSIRWSIKVPTAELQWVSSLAMAVVYYPACHDHPAGLYETIFASTSDRRMRSVREVGSSSAQGMMDFGAGGMIQSCPAVKDFNGDGLVEIVFGSTDKNVYALTFTPNQNGLANCQLYWTFATNGEVVSSPAIDAVGNVYIGSCDDNLYVIGRDYKTNPSSCSSYTTSGDITTSPALSRISYSGICPYPSPWPTHVYVGSLDDHVYALGPPAEWPNITAPNPDEHAISITADNVKIEGLSISGATGSDKYGIFLDGVDHCDISNNIFTDNNGGILLRSCKNCVISGNTIDSHPGNGICITDASVRNWVTNNNLNQNHYGIIISNGSNYNVISDNFVSSSDWAGIRLNWLEADFAPVMYNEISNNVLSGNHEGIFLDYPSSNNLVSYCRIVNNDTGIRLRQSSQNMISYCTISNNDGDGILCEESSSSFNHNNILDNGGFGVQNTDTTVTIDAENNWWGDPSGPGGVSAGTGDEISDGVNYDSYRELPLEAHELEAAGKDSDFDGVSNDGDQCYNPDCALVDEIGCPLDSDGDAIPDCEDECPEEAGTEEEKGCPEAGINGLFLMILGIIVAWRLSRFAE